MEKGKRESSAQSHEHSENNKVKKHKSRSRSRSKSISHSEHDNPRQDEGEEVPEPGPEQPGEPLPVLDPDVEGQEPQRICGSFKNWTCVVVSVLAGILVIAILIFVLVKGGKVGSGKNWMSPTKRPSSGHPWYAYNRMWE